MQKSIPPLRASLMAMLLATACSVQAAPDAASKATPDEIGQFILDRGLAAKVQVTQVAQTASNIVVSAMGFLGLPYKRGGNSFETGFDCSGFVKALYE